jgi:solute carrier family 24 (sodium/potassium/calcium exchanger), member 6
MPGTQTQGYQSPRPSSLEHSRFTSYPLPRSTSRHRLASFSLLGALEFRSVVTSLRRDSAAPILYAFESPHNSGFAGAHYHRRSRESAHGFDTESNISQSPSLGDYRTPTLADSPLRVQPLQYSPKQIAARETPRSLPSLEGALPSSNISAPLNVDTGTQVSTKRSKRGRVWKLAGQIARVVFPTLHRLRTKSVLGIMASILAAPAVLLLTISLPVVISHTPDESKPQELLREGQLIDLEPSESEEAILYEAQEDAQDGLTFNKWLTATQLTLGPLFVVAVCFGHQPYALWLELATLIAGVSSAVLVLVFSVDGKHATARLTLCLTGFAVSMVWIMAIADEVVQVLNVCPHFYPRPLTML